jgi:hypothetical protein
MITGKRVLGKIFCEGCRQPSVGSETLVVAKTGPHFKEYP